MSARVLVCGSRTYGDRDSVWTVLDGLYLNHSIGYLTAYLTPFTVIEGRAPGADSLAGDWVDYSPLHGPCLEDELHPAKRPDECYVVHKKFPANWNKYGKRAGFLRNTQMLEEGLPDLVVAFVDKPLEFSRGTAMMVDLAEAAGVETWVTERTKGLAFPR